MSDYCALDDGLALLGGLTLTATSQVTSVQADAMLAQVGAEIDMHLRGLGYALPVTDDEALASLDAIARQGVAAYVGRAWWPNTSGPGGASGVVEERLADYRAGLAFIDRGGLALDVPSESASASVAYDFERDYSVQGSAYNDDEYEAPF